MITLVPFHERFALRCPAIPHHLYHPHPPGRATHYLQRRQRQKLESPTTFCFPVLRLRQHPPREVNLGLSATNYHELRNRSARRSSAAKPVRPREDFGGCRSFDRSRPKASGWPAAASLGIPPGLLPCSPGKRPWSCKLRLVFTDTKQLFFPGRPHFSTRHSVSRSDS